MIIQCESTWWKWTSKSTTKVRNFKVVKRIPRDVTFSTDFSRLKLISAEDGKTVIYDGFGYGTLIYKLAHKASPNINRNTLYVQVGDDFDINTPECFLY